MVMVTADEYQKEVKHSTAETKILTWVIQSISLTFSVGSEYRNIFHMKYNVAKGWNVHPGEI